jgi:two-component system response regulator RegA
LVQGIKRVLVVDDDETLLSSLSRSLRRLDKTVVATTDPAQARRLAKAEKFDLAIVDLRLGSVSGLDVVRDLKELQANLKIVVMSGYMNVAVAVEAVKAGAVDVLFKPFAVKDILDRAENGTRQEPELDLMSTPTLEEVQYEHCARVVADSGGNVSKAARRLGVHRQSLQRWLRRPTPKR